VAQWLMNPTRDHEVVGSIPGLLNGLRIRHCCELWRRLQTWLGSRVLLWLRLWRRPAATAPIQPPAWEPPYAVGAALEMAKKKKKKKPNKQTKNKQKKFKKK